MQIFGIFLGFCFISFFLIGKRVETKSKKSAGVYYQRQYEIETDAAIELQHSKIYYKRGPANAIIPTGSYILVPPIPPVVSLSHR